MPWDDGLTTGSAAHLIAASQNSRIRVIAGPGTGKSFAMKRRVARLLEEGVDPALILPVTFTRVAAEDLHRELVGMNVRRCDEIKGTTLHSLALRILMREHVLTALGRIPRPLNEFEMKPLVADLSHQYGGNREVKKKIKAYEAAWARLDHEIPGSATQPLDTAFEHDLTMWLSFHRAMLIGEVIPKLHDYLKSNPHAQERNEFAHILVDEFQDLNRAEQVIIDLLSENGDVCIVGDDDQSIYSFRHAHPRGILDWVALNKDADDLTLDQCQRCPTLVVAMANSLIGNNGNRQSNRSLLPIAARGEGVVEILQFENIDAEAKAVASRIKSLISTGTEPGDILVLAQRNIIGTPIFNALTALGVPARSYYAESELDSEVAQERLSYLKILSSIEDRVAMRWLLGHGKNDWRSKGYQRIRNYCEETGKSIWDALAFIAGGNIKISYTKPIIEKFREIRSNLDAYNSVLERENLSGLVDMLFPEGKAELRGIRQLSNEVIEKFGNQDLNLFVKELVTSIAQPEIQSEVTEVRIMSLNKSKGLSSPVTIIAGCVDGLLPKQPDQSEPEAAQRASIEEQRRLFFVGLTRVKAAPEKGKPGTLILTYSATMPSGSAMTAFIQPAKSSYGTASLRASRFIRELGRAAPEPVKG